MEDASGFGPPEQRSDGEEDGSRRRSGAHPGRPGAPGAIRKDFSGTRDCSNRGQTIWERPEGFAADRLRGWDDLHDTAAGPAELPTAVPERTLFNSDSIAGRPNRGASLRRFGLRHPAAATERSGLGTD